MVHYELGRWRNPPQAERYWYSVMQHHASTAWDWPNGIDKKDRIAGAGLTSMGSAPFGPSSG